MNMFSVTLSLLSIAVVVDSVGGHQCVVFLKLSGARRSQTAPTPNRQASPPEE